MPRFFIDTHGATGVIQDDVGEEFADSRAARHCALLTLQDLLASATGDSDRYALWVGVRNACGRLVYRADLSVVGRRFELQDAVESVYG